MKSSQFFATTGLSFEQKAPYCEKLSGNLLFTSEVWSPTFTALQSFSALALLFVVYTIYGDESLRKHPATIIGLICVINAFYAFMNLSKVVICPWNGEVVFAATVYFDTSEASLLRAMNTLTYSYLNFLVISYNAPSILELCLLYDMLWTIKNPTKRPESRVRWYILGTILWQVVTLVINAASDFNTLRWPVQLIFYVTKLLYIFMFFPAIIMLTWHFKKDGLNQQYKKLYIRRYVLFVSLMLVCNITSIIDFANLTGVISLPLTVQLVLAFYFVTVPFLYATIRLSEPSVFASMKRKFKRLFNN